MHKSSMAVAIAAVLVVGCGDGASKTPRSFSANGGEGKTGRSAVGVVLEQAGQESFPYEIEALGTANANEAVTITAKTSNLVTAIHFREGEQVKRGEVLVELDGAEARAELAASRAALSESQSQYKRSQELAATQALSQSALEQIEATLRGNEARVATAESKVRDTVIRAPFDGRVGLRRISVGSLISPGTLITTVDDTRTIKLDFSVPENFMSVLKEGLTITARSVAYPDKQFRGFVVSIDSRVDPTTRSVIARAAIPNPEDRLKPGMFLTVRLQQPRENVVMISEQALVPEAGQQYVFVVKDNRAEKRPVNIGRRKPGRVEVLSGLTAGEQIVIEGTQSVRDGAAVRDAGSSAGRAQAAS